MKLNNKGFAVSTIMYMILVLAVLVMALTLTALSGRKLIIDKQKNIALTNIYGELGNKYSNFGGAFVEPTQTDTHKGIVYLNPTNISYTCDAQLALANVNSNGTPTGINTGCMKFYIYDDTGDNYKMILDHNTSGNLQWNSSGSNSTMNEVANRLNEDTFGWVGNPRLITADEVAHIVGADSNSTIKWTLNKNYNESPSDIDTYSSWYYLDASGTTYSASNGWQKPTANASNKSRYAWLYDNTYLCNTYGCNIEDNNMYPHPTKNSTYTSYIYGYWTNDATTGSSTTAWRVGDCGNILSMNANVTDIAGVRPVITIPKSVLNN